MMMDAPSSTKSASPSNAEERALETGFFQRSAWAFEAAYFAHRRLLYGAAYKVLGNGESAEDCVHDVLLRLWKQGHGYTPARGSLRAFLCVCVRNEALTRLRRQRTHTRIETGLSAALPQHTSMDEGAVRSLDLAQSLDSLSESQRETIRLAYYEGLTHEEIARRLGEPVGTVKSRISNALQRLRAALAGERRR